MSNIENNLVVDPSPFGPNFKSQINGMVTNEVERVVEKTSKTAITVAVPSLLLLTGCSSKDGLSLDHNQFIGLVSGGICAIEEGFEKDTNRNFGKKVVSIASKFGAGYMAGYAISHNSQNGSWLSEENLTTTISLIPSAYVLARETSFTQLVDRFSSNVKGKISEAKTLNKEAELQDKLSRLARQAYSSNIKEQNRAWQEVQSLRIDPKIIRDIHSGKINPREIHFSK